MCVVVLVMVGIKVMRGFGMVMVEGVKSFIYFSGLIGGEEMKKVGVKNVRKIGKRLVDG